MNRIYQKLKAWYRGENTSITLRQIFEALKQSQKHLESKELHISDMLKPPLISLIFNAIGRFWNKHWKWSIGIFLITISAFATLGILVVMILKYLKMIN